MDSRRQAILLEDGKGTIRGLKRDGVACRAVLKSKDKLGTSVPSGVRRGTLRGPKRDGGAC
ncbi:hypothetical protein A2U01_0102244 [Trifolium medium]|uniref:Uncharacterized protein n=1 Tax=Trifolium medium TaxID=97028 RepID=A0A392V0P0_9FABA|nr:hypothetical protein [Trifolium medium]